MAESPIAAPAETPAISHGRLKDYLALTKPRITSLVVASTIAGWYMGKGEGFDLKLLLHLLAGTALCASGANALNQYMERDVDQRMRRTEGRPLPDARLLPRQALVFAVVAALGGVAVLALGVNPLTAVVAAVTVASYVFLYTPLKRTTSLSTIVGAVPGALPPVGGWAAARGTLGIEPWVLFAIVFLWQLPHFLAIAWMYREDYARGGFPMLPVLEPDGVSTGRQAFLYAVALFPVSLLPAAVGLSGSVYPAGAALLGALYAALAWQFSRQLSLAAARRLFYGSLVYLPILWALLMADKGA